MKVFFVRHGSTTSIENRLYQKPDDPLSPYGIVQSQELANNFDKISLDLIISSSHVRALDTAKMISNNIVVSDLFVEVRKPSCLIGGSKDDSKNQLIIQKIREMYTLNTDWHYADEENFSDLKSRGQQALDFIISQNKQNILVVSHANFITFLVGLMIYGREFSPISAQKFKNYFLLDNTGISVCTYDANQWHMQCWNNTQHCGQ